jgi:hypothetical protein
LSTHWRQAQIEIQHASEDIAKLPLEIISNIKETFDCSIDLDEVALITENEKLWNAIKGLKDKGIRVRFVTALNEGNISFCRQMMKCGEVFHYDKIKGNFQIADGINYSNYIIENKGEEARRRKQEQKLFHTNTKSFVDIQQYLFNNLCNNAISAKEKIKEIGRGTRSEFADTINEPSEIRKIVTNLLMSAKDEILGDKLSQAINAGNCDSTTITDAFMSYTLANGDPHFLDSRRAAESNLFNNGVY